MPRAPVRAALLGAGVAALALAGCSTSDESAAPPACTEGPETIERALRQAPDRVTLDGTPISDCFSRSTEAADLQTIGFSFTEVAAELSREAQAQPEGEAATELGYLVGAARAGAGETQGIHDELLRRIEQELAGVDTRSEAFRTGERAGRESG